MSERDKIRQQKVLESLAKQGFTVYNGKKVTFVEAEQLKTADEKTAAELISDKKLTVLSDIKDMLGSWSINERRLTTFVEAAKKCSFMDILENFLQGKELSSKQVYTIQELKRNLEFLAQHEDSATTILLPSIAEKLIARVIINFYDNREYLDFTRELLNERESSTITLMEIYTGKITAEKINQLTSGLNEAQSENAAQESDSLFNDTISDDNNHSCLAGEDCDQGADL